MQVHVERPQLACHLTHTTAATHAMIEANLHETPKYGGWVESKGPRYCPSIEDKVVRFKDKPSHQVRGCRALLHIPTLTCIQLSQSHTRMLVLNATAISKCSWPNKLSNFDTAWTVLR